MIFTYILCISNVIRMRPLIIEQTKFNQCQSKIMKYRKHIHIGCYKCEVGFKNRLRTFVRMLAKYKCV